MREDKNGQIFEFQIRIIIFKFWKLSSNYEDLLLFIFYNAFEILELLQKMSVITP